MFFVKKRKKEKKERKRKGEKKKFFVKWPVGGENPLDPRGEGGGAEAHPGGAAGRATGSGGCRARLGRPPWLPVSSGDFLAGCRSVGLSTGPCLSDD